MIRTISIFILITTGLLAKNYFIEVADEGGDEGETETAEEAGGEQGLDFSFLQNFEMVQDGQLNKLFSSSSLLLLL